MTRHFAPGWEATVGGFDFRVVKGKKRAFGGTDYELDIWDASRQRWRPVAMEIGFLLADFFYDNEEVRYPPAMQSGWQGGKRYMSDCWLAVKKGWGVAAEKLRRERAALPDPVEVWIP